MRWLLALILALGLVVPAIAAEPTVIDKIEAKLGKPLDANQKLGVIEYSRRAKSSLLSAQRQYVDGVAHRLAAPPSAVWTVVPQNGAPIDGIAVATVVEKELGRKLTAEDKKNLAAVDGEHQELTGRVLAAYRDDLARATGLPSTSFEGLLP